MSRENPHDEIFKQVESVKENAVDFIMGTFPKKITAKLDFSTLNIQNTSYTDEKLGKYFSDLVYHCKYNNSTIEISLLFEHKSYHVKYPHLQLLRYLLNMFESRLKEKEPFIPIIPVVFYHGKKEWERKNFYDYFTGLDKDLKAFIPNFDYILTDLSGYDDKNIKNKLFKRDANKILMLIMKHIKEEEVISDSLFDIFVLGKDYFSTEEGKSFLISIVTYLFKTTEIEDVEVANTLEQIIHGGGDIIMTTAMKLEQRGEQRGIQLGEKRGIQLGEKRGIQLGEKRGIQLGEKRGIEQGEKKAELITASKMLKDGFDFKTISKYTTLTIKEIQDAGK